MSSNFDFLKEEWSSIYSKMIIAEGRIFNEPVSSASYCRTVLEECIHHIYELEYFEMPYNSSLANLMIQEEFRNLLSDQILNGIHYVRKVGNNAAHFGNRVSGDNALISIKYLFTFLKWFANNYSSNKPELPVVFSETNIAEVGDSRRKLKVIQSESAKVQKGLEGQIAELLKEKADILAKAEESEEALSRFRKEQQQQKITLATRKQERKKVISLEFTEAETRKHIIDVNLREAGWYDLHRGREIEYPVTGMPITRDNPKGNGFVDYVLWDDNGLPLALIEAKRTSKDVEVGRHQAFLYANCLEKEFGRRPVIFYTNGYELNLWNDSFYSTPRRIYGYFKKDELQWLIQQRQSRKDIRFASINAAIAGRPYQLQAIKRVCESFVVDASEGQGIRGDKESALLVMATGSGKTRTAAALLELLMKNNWVKRALFLADRNALVNQAKDNFNELLPNISAIDLTKEKENSETRLVFSTYPSMMNRIDDSRNGDVRFYGSGHFDLIIIDEAHRSVYNKFGAIFEYFNALRVGLTATPKGQIDSNTFDLLGCPDNDPTFNYPLDEAVGAGYLNMYRNENIETKFLRDGIKYSELSDADKVKYENTFEDKSTGLFPEQISSSAINKWLFNKDTVNKVLDTFMQKGLKIEGGDKIGRTIIFAVNQKHAEFIVERFTTRYPQYPAGFIATVHNKVSHAQSLIKSFQDQYKENNPQIAVSVDMMDTGIDAPRVLNLIFFKVVRSYAKFWQMIGRGTRLCPDVYGSGKPKGEFLIFDVCQNFEFFEVNEQGNEGNVAKPITQQIFEARVQVSRLLAETGEIENIELSGKLLDMLHYGIAHLDKSRFEVQMKMRYVEEFQERSRWNNLDADSVYLIEEHLSGLSIPDTINEMGRRFDLLMLKLQLASLLNLAKEKVFHENLMAIAEGLSKKYTIPKVLESKPLIEEMREPDFYKKLSQKRMDEIREEIRELVQHLKNQGQQPIYLDIEDSEVSVTAGTPLTTAVYGSYKKRVERFIRQNKNHITISKLNTNIPITDIELYELEKMLFDGEERGTREDFEKEYGEQPLGEFIRSIVGLDIQSANQAFADLIQAGNLNADQMTFINNIITYLTKNGTIDKKMLFESPFTDIDDQGMFGVFNDAEVGKIISIINEVNGNARLA